MMNFCWALFLLMKLHSSFANSTCPGDHFTCVSDGSCVNRFLFCDGIANCSDGSDEIVYNASIHTPEDGFPCRHQALVNNLCLLPLDQENKRSIICREDAECQASEFGCPGFCFGINWFCDNVTQCSDGSDEIRYNVSLHTPEDGIPCRNKVYPDNRCLLPVDQADKEQIICRLERSCTVEELLCEGKCLNRNLFCDGIVDCSDGSDEIRYNASLHTAEDGIPCRQVTFKDNVCLLPFNQTSKRHFMCRIEAECTINEFECGGACFFQTAFCDKWTTCSDGSDEIVYDPKIHTEEDGIPCRSLSNFNSICLLPASQAYKKIELCRENAYCNVNEFECSGICVNRNLFCNGYVDCRDGTDEIRYDPSIHTAVDGIPCRNWRNIQNICLLPPDQASKEDLLCNADTECDGDNFLCSNGVGCITRESFCDGYTNCFDGSDEIAFVPSLHSEEDGVKCRDTVYTGIFCLLPADQANKQGVLCRQDSMCASDEFKCPESETCLKGYQFCDGVTNCKFGSDEIIYNPELHTAEDGIPCHNLEMLDNVCLLPSNQTHKKNLICRQSASCQHDEYSCLDGSSCIAKGLFCNSQVDCASDQSDELLVDSNAVDGISCKGSNSKSCLLPIEYVCDGKIDCVDHADECFCKNNTQIETVFSDDKCFRCLDRSGFIRTEQFCDEKIDCKDLSDECLCQNLPQGSGMHKICQQYNQKNVTSCLKSEKICDGRFDCEDGMDEEYCKTITAQISCTGNISLLARYQPQPCDHICPYTGEKARKCDGLPTCKYIYEEECEGCDYPPNFCKNVRKNELFRCPSSGRTFHGRYICVGNAECGDLEDELNCPYRFYCKGGSPLHIPGEKTCDLIADCDDSSDELGCRNVTDECESSSHLCRSTHFYCDDGGKTQYLDWVKKVCDGNQDCSSGNDECQNCTKKVFSNDKSLISSIALIPFLWIISIFAVFGNMFVLFLSISNLVNRRSKKCSPIENSQNILVLNLSLADLLVGIYTTAMCIQSSRFSSWSTDRYCLHDQEWRSGITCSMLGVILVIGSEESVFALTAITAFRLNAVLRRGSTISIRLVSLIMALSWILSIVLAVVPLSSLHQDYFVERIWYKQNSFVASIAREQVQDFSEKLITLQKINNSFIDEHGTIGSWTLVEALVKNLNPEYIPARRFGYYSTHGVCLPKLFPDINKDAAWGYSLLIILINFLSFFLIFGGYWIIYWKATGSSVSGSGAASHAAKLQRKVTRMVVTDLLCWMPICIMGFLQLSGIDISSDVYVPVGTVLIPINSALNPFLYSDAPEWLWDKLAPLRARLATCESNLWEGIRKREIQQMESGTYVTDTKTGTRSLEQTVQSETTI